MNKLITEFIKFWFYTQRLRCLVYELHAVVMHAVVHRLDRLVFFLFTLFERVNALILNKMNDKSIFVPVISNLTLCWVTSFCVDLAWHLNFLILSMTIVWLIQQAHWAATSSVSFWHLWMAV